MALQTNAVVAIVAGLVRLYPKTSVATAFELGMLAAILLRSARARRLVGAKTVDAVVLPARRKRKAATRTPATRTTATRTAAARKRKPVRRTKAVVPVASA